MTYALRELDRLEQTLRGDSVQITVLHGLEGIVLPVDTEIQVPWGVVRNLRSEETRLMKETPHVRSAAQMHASVVREAPATLQRVPTKGMFGDAPDWWERPTLDGLNLVEQLQLSFLIASHRMALELWRPSGAYRPKPITWMTQELSETPTCTPIWRQLSDT